MLIIDSVKKCIIDYKSRIKQIYRFFITLPSNVVRNIQQLYKHIIVLKSRLKNLGNINRDLGIHYLRAGNINEAIIRFKIGAWAFRKKGQDEINYWLALSYLLKGNIAYALKHISINNKYDKIGLYKFLHEYKQLRMVPQQIWSTYKDLTFDYHYKRFIVDGVDIVENFVNSIFSMIIEFPDDYKILDYGCNDGAIGHTMYSKVVKTFILTGVDVHPNMQTVTTNNTKIYNQVISMWPEDFIKEKAQSFKFDMIIACATIAYTRDITNVVSKLCSILKPAGHIALLLPYSESATFFDLQHLWFRYNIGDIQQMLQSLSKDRHLELVQSQDIKLLKNNANILYKVLLLQHNANYVPKN